jgi:hypothetical protein
MTIEHVHERVEEAISGLVVSPDPLQHRLADAWEWHLHRLTLEDLPDRELQTTWAAWLGEWQGRDSETETAADSLRVVTNEEATRLATQFLAFACLVHERFYASLGRGPVA